MTVLCHTIQGLVVVFSHNPFSPSAFEIGPHTKWLKLYYRLSARCVPERKRERKKKAFNFHLFSISLRKERGKKKETRLLAFPATSRVLKTVIVVLSGEDHPKTNERSTHQAHF